MIIAESAAANCQIIDMFGQMCCLQIKRSWLGQVAAVEMCLRMVGLFAAVQWGLLLQQSHRIYLIEFAVTLRIVRPIFTNLEVVVHQSIHQTEMSVHSDSAGYWMRLQREMFIEFIAGCLVVGYLKINQ